MEEFGKKKIHCVNNYLQKRCILLDLDLTVFFNELEKESHMSPIVLKDDDDKDDEDYASGSGDFIGGDARSCQLKRKRAQNGIDSRSTTWSDRQIKGIKAKGLSRYSPYGTRFSAMMEDGSIRESYLAGELINRSRAKGGKRIGLNLVHHQGEIEQLELAWDLIKHSQNSFGPGAVLEHLNSFGIDINYRFGETRMLLKNAGNFLKRVQEFGNSRAQDSSYLKQ
jgi:hypothetical protein